MFNALGRRSWQYLPAEENDVDFTRAFAAGRTGPAGRTNGLFINQVLKVIAMPTAGRGRYLSKLAQEFLDKAAKVN